MARKGSFFVYCSGLIGWIRAFEVFWKMITGANFILLWAAMVDIFGYAILLGRMKII